MIKRQFCGKINRFMDTNTHNQTPIFSVEGSSVHSHKRSIVWYGIAILTSVLIIVFSLYTKAWSFFIVYILAAGLYSYSVHKPIPRVLLEIAEEGIRYKNAYYPFEKCKEFWMINHHYDCELHIRVEHRLTDDLRIFIGHDNEQRVRELLGSRITENTKKHERLFDYITRLLKL